MHQSIPAATIPPGTVWGIFTLTCPHSRASAAACSPGGRAFVNSEFKIPRFRCTGSIILVSNIFVDVCTFTRNYGAHFSHHPHCLLQENRKSMIELQTSVKTSKQDDTTRTRTPKPGYLKLTNIGLLPPSICRSRRKDHGHEFPLSFAKMDDF
jgi:hypothetical protein